MAKITIAGDSAVITSSQTLEDIKTLEKYNPKALKLVETNDDGEREEVFRVCSTTGKGSINSYGASFGSTTHDDQKLATITVELPAGIANAKEYAAERFGAAIMLLNKIEGQFRGALDTVAAEREQVMQNITVAG